MMVYLRHGRYPLAVELHAPFFWNDSRTNQPESYLAGFPDPDAAAKARGYASRHGWKIAA